MRRSPSLLFIKPPVPSGAPVCEIRKACKTKRGKQAPAAKTKRCEVETRQQTLILKGFSYDFPAVASRMVL